MNSAITVPGSSHALVTDWNGDNAGPYQAPDYIAHWKQIQSEFPNATVSSCPPHPAPCCTFSHATVRRVSEQVVASTWDDFLTQVEPLVDALPVVTSELGDTWSVSVRACRAVTLCYAPLPLPWAQDLRRTL